jgi:hypothetical protein
MSKNKSNTTLLTLTSEQLASAIGGFGWSDVAKIAAAPGPMGVYYGAKALYNHGKKTGSEC